jgi:membrane protein implicated in regulation of membrane protease activity
MPTPRLMTVLLAAVGVVVAAAAALALQSWVVLGVVLAVHFVATILVSWDALRQAGDARDKPDPVTEARVEEEHAGGGPSTAGRVR